MVMIVIVDYRKFHLGIYSSFLRFYSSYSCNNSKYLFFGHNRISWITSNSILPLWKYVCVSVSLLIVLKPNLLVGGTFTDDQFLLHVTAKT